MTTMYILMAALVIAGWVAAYIGSRSLLKRTCAEFRLEMQRQMDTLSASVTALERTIGTLAAGASATSKAEEKQTLDEITPETMATITETITALLGRKVHIRSVKVLQVPNAVANTWSQQGRAVIQASHNLAQEGRER
jgi:hypothetical protein